MVSQPWVAPFVKEPSLLRKLRRAGIYLVGFERAIELRHLNIDNGNVSSSQQCPPHRMANKLIIDICSTGEFSVNIPLPTE